MATKGYVVFRCSGPHGAPGVNEAWSEAINKLFSEKTEEWKAAGGIGWRHTVDVFRNSPRAQLMSEFETVEQAIAWYLKLESTGFYKAFVDLGTLDFEVSVHRLSGEE